MQKTDEFSIGVLSERSGVHIETIRYYEKIGVMPKPARSAAGTPVASQQQWFQKWWLEPRD